MFELRLMCPQDRVDQVSDALAALDALSVSVEDADAQTDSEHALFGEPGLPPPQTGWERSRIQALFSAEDPARHAAAVLQAQDFFAGCVLHGIEPLADQDWVRLTQQQFAPVEITPQFWIVPTWHEAPAQARTVIRLDPGLAFGTGTHPTTRMCLRWIAAHGQRSIGDADRSTGPTGLGRTLDYGCGSGILAIGAALHGAAPVDALDIDPGAVQAARDNAQANRVALRVGLPELVSGRYQTVLANILATPLKVLAPLLCVRVQPGGWLVLAGILERQAGELVAAYAPHAKLQIGDREDGWILMLARL